MVRLPRLLAVLILFNGAAACTVAEDVFLAGEMVRFAEDVAVVTAVIAEEFELAEEINTLGFTDSLIFQLELGGTPDTDLKPLFSPEDVAARQDLLAALEGYVAGIATLGRGQSPTAAYTDIASAAAGLKSLAADNFSLSHSLSLLQSDQLVNDLNLFDQFFLLPERDRRLAPILEKGGEAFRKAALLLYVDIGAPSDQSSKCSFTTPPNDIEDDLRNIKLCRGGLRSIVATAIAFDVTVWKDRLAHLAMVTADHSADRRAIVTHLIGLQKLAASADALLAQTQAALVAMVATHTAIAAAVGGSGGGQQDSATLMAASRMLLFQEEAAALKKRLQDARTTLAAIAAAAPTPPPARTAIPLATPLEAE